MIVRMLVTQDYQDAGRRRRLASGAVVDLPQLVGARLVAAGLAEGVDDAAPLEHAAIGALDVQTAPPGVAAFEGATIGGEQLDRAVLED